MDTGTSIDITGLIQQIQYAKSLRSRIDRLIQLEQIGDQIKANISKLPIGGLQTLSAEFSAAFKPLGEKPRSAVEVIVLIDRLVMNNYSSVYARGRSDLPHSEFTPHLVGASAPSDDTGDLLKHFLSG